MMFKSASVPLVSVLALGLSASMSYGHAVLVKSVPDDGGILTQDDRELRLTFSEALEPRFSTFKIEAADGDDSTVSISFDDDHRRVVLRLDRMLRAGNYRLRWKLVATDMHKMEGSLSFSVR
jgi:methionine-rich copper-binding protein CopC